MSAITNEELEKLSNCSSREEWGKACDQIKKAHGGYPSDWYSKVKLSGLGDAVAERFGEKFELKIKEF
jgi:hypothetical protein